MSSGVFATHPQSIERKMINLLPEQDKKELRYAVIFHKTVLLSFFFLIFLTVLLGATLFLKILLTIQTKQFNKTLSAMEMDLRRSQLQGFRQIIGEENEKLSRVNRLWHGQIFFTPFFEKLSVLKTPDVYFDQITWQKVQGVDDKNSASAQIFGFAKSRDQLLIFLQNLKKEQQFLVSSSTLSSLWDKPNDITFHLKMTFFSPFPF